MMPSPDNPTPRAQQFAKIMQAARTRATEAIKKPTSSLNATLTATAAQSRT
ncbi:unnamed protein product, partial [Closterium sp. NIES-54]